MEVQHCQKIGLHKFGKEFILTKTTSITCIQCKLIWIGSDYVVYFIDDEVIATSKTRSSTSLTKKRKKSKLKTWYLGRVQRMRQKIGGRLIDYKMGFDLMSKPEGLEVQLGWYSKAKGARMYSYDSIDLHMVDIECIIALANLSYDPSKDRYKLDENDHMVFTEFIRVK